MPCSARITIYFLGCGSFNPETSLGLRKCLFCRIGSDCLIRDCFEKDPASLGGAVAPFINGAAELPPATSQNGFARYAGQRL